MDNLFGDEPAWRGSSGLEVSWADYRELESDYPELNLPSEFRDMNAWLVDPSNARKKPKKLVFKFIRTWLAKSKKDYLREQRRDERVRMEVNVGSGPR